VTASCDQSLKPVAAPNYKPRSLALGTTKIGSPDPPLTIVFTAYSARPLLPFFTPSIGLAARRGCLHFDRWIDFAALQA
jgi:hypothetical protein